MVIASSKCAFRSVLTNLRERSIWSYLPFFILLIGMSTTVFFVQDRGYFHRNTWDQSEHFEWHSSHNLTIAVNLAPSHNFLGFVNRIVGADGNIDYGEYSGLDTEGYHVYNRFPPGGYILIKLITLPFGDDLSNRIHAARMLMLALSIGTAVLAYWSLCRLISNRWMASAVVLIAFSSTQFLFFNDMIITEVGPDIFGFVLAFHGMIIFEREGRFRQFIIKSCIALLLGWHVIALLLTFILLKLGKEVIHNRKEMFSRELWATIGSRRYVTLGAVVLGLSLLILAYNIGTEYHAFNVRTVDQLSLVDLPSLQSILFRTGLNQQSVSHSVNSVSHSVISISFLEGQLSRIGLMSLPFVWMGSSSSYVDDSWRIIVTQYLFVGIVVVGVCMVGIFLVRHRLLAMTALTAGFVWAILMHRYSIFHGFDALFHIGIPIFFYTLVLLCIRKLLSERLMSLTSLIALLIFISSSYRMGYSERNDREVEFHRSVVSDFESIREFTRGKNVFTPVTYTYKEMNRLVGSTYGMQYYLSGSGVVFDNYGCDNIDVIDFVVTTSQNEMPSLTPDNRMFFLYTRETYEENLDKLVSQNRPVIQGDFDIYLTEDRRLVYVGDRCDRNEDNLSSMFGAPISLVIYPVNTEDLPVSDLDYELVNFNFIENLAADTKRYFKILDLPGYAIDNIKTRQYTDGDRTWVGSFFGPDHVVNTDLRQRVDQVVISLEPIIRNHFDVYLTREKSLMYVRKPCHNGDVSDDFFLHVFPVDEKYLTQDRIQNGFNNLDFTFIDHGTRYGQSCAAEVKLPDYDIASIFTGQFTYRGPIWQSEFRITDH